MCLRHRVSDPRSASRAPLGRPLNAPVCKHTGMGGPAAWLYDTAWPKDHTGRTKRAPRHPRSRKQRTGNPLVRGNPKFTQFGSTALGISLAHFASSLRTRYEGMLATTTHPDICLPRALR